MDLLVISDFFISSFGLSIFILSRLYAPACLLRLHTTFHVIRCIQCIIEVRSTHYHSLVQNAAAPIKQVMIIQLLQWTMSVARVS